MQTLKPRLDILPPPQRRLWLELDQLESSMILYGGTALALHMGHRESIDFDFFTHKSFDPKSLYEGTPFLKNATVLQQKANTLTCRVDRDGFVKVSFFSTPQLKRIEDPLLTDDHKVRVASLPDLAATKALVVQQRSEAKDYIDIAVMLDNGITLTQMLNHALFAWGPSFNPQITLKALCYFDDGDLHSLDQEIKDKLIHVVASAKISEIKTTKGLP